MQQAAENAMTDPMMVSWALDIVILVLCAAIAVIDWRSGIIPNWCNLLMGAAGLTNALVAEGVNGLFHLIDAALIFLLFFLLRWAYGRWRGRTGLGLGDVKFLAAASLRTGLGGLNVLVLVACLTGLLELLVRRLLGQSVNAATRLRFGPHLALGLTLVILFDRG
jgi:leader peptidase (prepilin peptidase) / N-methyltransferase